MALFILLAIALVVGQSWLEWKDTRQRSVLPEWAKGVGLAFAGLDGLLFGDKPSRDLHQ